VTAETPPCIRLTEVGPRDGLQSEPEIISLDAKVRFIERLSDAGLPAIEIGSFVRRDRVPQMADTEDVARRLKGRTDAVLIALVPNLRGLDRALDVGLSTIAVFTAASDAFATANIGMRVDESLGVFRDVVRSATQRGAAVRGYISTAWWCPYTGPVEPDAVRRVALALLDMGCANLGIADTIGAATPGEVRRLLELLLREIPVQTIGVHFHDTRGTALANVLASMEMGITAVDASAGGLGGCPFAPGALGNLATEDLVYMLHGMGVKTGVDLEKLRGASLEMEAILERPLPSRYLHAGPMRRAAV
jgi:hydroxymethylglutaryl-CoA lyase